jgi:hypothetical protein
VDETEQMVRRRARVIFDRENTNKNVVWGDETPDGRQAFAFQERENPSAPTITILAPEMRKRYVERARQELKDEGLLP